MLIASANIAEKILRRCELCTQMISGVKFLVSNQGFQPKLLVIWHLIFCCFIKKIIFTDTPPLHYGHKQANQQNWFVVSLRAALNFNPSNDF